MNSKEQFYYHGLRGIQHKIECKVKPFNYPANEALYALLYSKIQFIVSEGYVIEAIRES